MALTKIDDRGLKTPIDLLDNEKIRFGTGNDLQLYADGSNSYISHNGDGNLRIFSGGTESIKCTEAGATHLFHNGTEMMYTHSLGIKLNDSKRIYLGTSADLQLYHDGTYTWSIDASTGGWHSKSSKFVWQAYDDAENMAIFHQDGACRFWYDGSEKLTTTASGAKLSGHLAINNSTQSKIVLDTSDGSDNKWLNINGGGDASQSRGGGIMFGGNEYSGHEGRVWILAGNSGNTNGTIDFSTAGSIRASITNDGHFKIPNDSGRIKLGIGADLQIYHNGSDSVIADTNASSDLFINSNKDLTLKIGDGAGGNHTALYADNNGAVRLYWDNSNKLSTASYGASVNDTKLAVQVGSNAGSIVINRNGHITSNIRPSDDTSIVGGGSGGGSRITLNKNYLEFKTFPYVTNVGDAVTYTTRARIDGDGLKFGSDTAAANGLDDYEEGSWTPTDESGASLTFTSVNAWYVKVGDLITMGARFAYPTTTNTNQNKIGGFPFSPGTNIFSVGSMMVGTVQNPMGNQGSWSGMDQTGRLRTENASIPYNDDLSGQTVYLSYSYRT